jgi:hypothetical protein
MKQKSKKPMLTSRRLLERKAKKYLRLTKNNSYNQEIQLRKKQLNCKHLVAKTIFSPMQDSALVVCARCGVVMAKVGQF